MLITGFFSFQGQWKSHYNDFFKTWVGLDIDAQIQRLTYRQTGEHKKSENLTDQPK